MRGAVLADTDGADWGVTYRPGMSRAFSMDSGYLEKSADLAPRTIVAEAIDGLAGEARHVVGEDLQGLGPFTWLCRVFGGR